jgi:hypothetical protein
MPMSVGCGRRRISDHGATDLTWFMLSGVGLPVRTSRDVADQIDAEWSRSGPDDDADERRMRPATDLGPWCDEGNKFQTAAVDDFGSELNLLCNGSGVGR